MENNKMKSVRISGSHICLCILYTEGWIITRNIVHVFIPQLDYKVFVDGDHSLYIFCILHGLAS